MSPAPNARAPVGSRTKKKVKRKMLVVTDDIVVVYSQDEWSENEIPEINLKGRFSLV